eukprot:TRINITY_DN7314_c0_g1_i2.p1 TRINITY_DN7314_c0_g1~~TRINITY_DN7314_c0_g1_i2.p1  ORF type:complete len:412 (-),score=70.84 TRINITY_DN7314_c0_g1_i2:34-1269(-)
MPSTQGSDKLWGRGRLPRVLDKSSGPSGAPITTQEGTLGSPTPGGSGTTARVPNPNPNPLTQTPAIPRVEQARVRRGRMRPGLGLGLGLGYRFLMRGLSVFMCGSVVQFCEGNYLVCTWESCAHWHGKTSKGNSTVILESRGFRYELTFLTQDYTLNSAASRPCELFLARPTVQDVKLGGSADSQAQDEVIGRLLPARPLVGLDDAGVLRGWMGKRSGLFIKSWEVRWVELDVKAGTIRYYAKDTPLSEGACTRGVIYLFETDGRRVRQMHALADNDGQRFCFRIQNNKEHVFSACSHEQRKLWLDTLSAIAQAASGPRRHDSVTVASPEEQYAMASETISDLEAEVSELTQLTLRCNEESTISDEFVMVRCGCQKSLPPVQALNLSLIHISEPTRLLSISYAVFCLKKKK